MIRNFRIIKKSFDLKNVDSETFRCLILTGGQVVYDETGGGAPLLISNEAVINSELPEQVFLSLDHQQGVLERIGFVDQLEHKENEIWGVAHIIRTTQAGKDSIELLKSRIITDISPQLKTLEEWNGEMLEIVQLILKEVSLVTEGADPQAKVLLN